MSEREDEFFILISISALLAWGVYMTARKFFPTSSYDVPFGETFRIAETTYNIPNFLLVEIARQESNFDPKAISNKGAQGIMQIVPRWHPGIDPYNPERAIMYAANYLRTLYIKTGSWRGALAAYNWGIGNLSKFGFDKMPTETRTYIAKISGNLPYTLG